MIRVSSWAPPMALTGHIWKIIHIMLVGPQSQITRLIKASHLPWALCLQISKWKTELKDRRKEGGQWWEMTAQAVIPSPFKSQSCPIDQSPISSLQDETYRWKYCNHHKAVITSGTWPSLKIQTLCLGDQDRKSRRKQSGIDYWNGKCWCYRLSFYYSRSTSSIKIVHQITWINISTVNTNQSEGGCVSSQLETDCASVNL